MALPLDADVLRLDRDAPLALEVHRVEVLLAHLPRVDGAGDLEDAVRQRRLAVVDVGDDREVADPARSMRSRCCRRGREPPVVLVRLFDRHVRRRRRPVANIKSQKKRNLTNAKRAERNKAAKSELKTRVKTATTSIGTDDQRRGRPPRRQAPRHGRRQGRHPPQPGRPPQEPPDEEGQRLHLTLGPSTCCRPSRAAGRQLDDSAGTSTRLDQRRSRESRATRTSITRSSGEVAWRRAGRGRRRRAGRSPAAHRCRRAGGTG